MDAVCQNLNAESVKNDIIFEYEHGACIGSDSLSHALHVGFMYSLLIVGRVFFYNDKLDPVRQADVAKLFPGLLTPVLALIQRDAIDLVEKGPRAGW